VTDPLPSRMLIVGLGGIGADTVRALRAMASAEPPDRFVWHLIDTDANHPRDPDVGVTLLWLAGPAMANLGRIAFERPDTHGWFPLWMADRAAREAHYWRVGARLAFAEAMQRPETLLRLEADVDRLCQRPSTPGVAGPPAVVLVGSLAGATSSGIALQTALYLRHAVADRLGVDPGLVPVHGLFLLPEALVATGLLPPNIAEVARARAYATVKEIAGIDAALAGTVDQEIRLEYLPGRGATPVTHRPFRSVYVVDQPSHLEGALGSIPEHLAFALQALLARVGGAVNASRRGDPSGDPDHGGHERSTTFATIASARLEFPRKAVAWYVAERWVHEDVDAAWLSLERAFEEQLEAYEHDVFADAVPEPPTHATAFASLLASEDDEGPRGALLRRVRRQVGVPATTGRERNGSRAGAWLDALQRRLEEVAEAQPGPWRRPTPDELADRATVWAAIDRSERDLTRWRGAIRDRARAAAATVADAALAYDLDDGVLERGTDAFRLPYWLFDDEGILHPLAVRHLAYAAQELLGARLTRLRGDVELLERELDAYEHAYDDVTTPERVETALDRLSGALSQPAITRLFRDDLAQFTEAYDAGSARHAATLRVYERAMHQLSALERVARGVEGLAHAWERAFAQLRLGGDRLRHASRAAEGAHERSLDPFVRYVHADEAAKRRLYEACRERADRVDARQAEADTVRAVYRGLAHPWDRHPPAAVLLEGLQAAVLRALGASDSGEDGAHGEEDGARGEDGTRRVDAPDASGGPIPLDVLEALARDAGTLGVDADEHLRQRIRDLTEAVTAASPRGTTESAGLTLLAHSTVATRLPQEVGVGDVVALGTISRQLVVAVATFELPTVASAGPFAPASSRGPAGRYRAAYDAVRREHDDSPFGPSEASSRLHLDPQWLHGLPDLGEGPTGTDR
jgi:hypothetical protein